MHTFQINILIQFLASSTRFEHHLFIIRKTICTCSFVWYLIYCHCNYSMKNIPYKTGCTNGLPDDKHVNVRNMYKAPRIELQD